MQGYLIGFALLSISIFTLPWILEWRWIRVLKADGMSVRSLTSPKRWTVYAICGSSEIIAWIVSFWGGYIPPEASGTTFVGSMMIAFGIMATMRMVVDVRPAYNRISQR